MKELKNMLPSDSSPIDIKYKKFEFLQYPSLPLIYANNFPLTQGNETLNVINAINWIHLQAIPSK